MRKLLFFCLAFISLLTPVSAQNAAAPATPQKIRVVTRNVEPFSFEQDGKRVGFAMELWENVARESGFQYEVQVVGTPQEMIDALVNKTADAGVGALSVTSKREEIIDFSQPFYESGFQILVSGTTATLTDTIVSLVAGLLNWKLIGMFMLLVFTMLVISHLVWMCEHRINEEMWPKNYIAGMWESFWWTISTLLVGGADNKGPIGVGGRIVAILWMLLSIVLVSLLTASFTTTMTVNTLKGGINGPQDLPDKKVATIGGSSSEKWLNDRPADRKSTVVPFKTLTECIEALKKKDVEAVVYDAPMLQYALQKNPDEKLQLVEGIFVPSNYAIAFQQDSPLREKVNQALLSLYEGGIRDKLKDEWFGKDANQ